MFPIFMSIGSNGSVKGGVSVVFTDEISNTSPTNTGRSKKSPWLRMPPLIQNGHIRTTWPLPPRSQRPRHSIVAGNVHQPQKFDLHVSTPRGQSSHLAPNGLHEIGRELVLTRHKRAFNEGT